MPDPDAVNSLFSRIAGRYDLANRLLSGGVDVFWRRRLVALVGKGRPADILDLATGSGDLAFALCRGLPGARVTGADFCEPMLERARAKQAAAAPRFDAVRFERADAMRLPFPEASFDAVTIAFGLRNLADRPAALAGFRRVLRPGGCLCVLEFSQPRAFFRPFYYFYLKRVLPRLAAFVTGDRGAYEYLAGSIEGYPGHEGIRAELAGAGFRDVRVSRPTFGVVAIHQAWR
ncbi:MAG: ubiquinone/menaquinone biosynthesis methyltransferase [Opitutaceae bacterium]|jgi:demethylmenaquinone methyltransferase/2-methoxy-6-polyprenyl-1,4-benzoquinol methylase|nr:ubiquinone/menaquinone biosynthesis methyltransferase [Opitutaceae bacterium]